MSQGGVAAVGSDSHAKLLRNLAWKLRCRNLQQSSAFKDVFSAHSGLLHINEKLRQQTLQQDKVWRGLTCFMLGITRVHRASNVRPFRSIVLYFQHATSAAVLLVDVEYMYESGESRRFVSSTLQSLPLFVLSRIQFSFSCCEVYRCVIFYCCYSC